MIPFYTTPCIYPSLLMIYNICLQLHPQSLQLYELMCWCWSDKPQHRPTFEQILDTVKRDSFTHLLEAIPVTVSDKKNMVTAACITSSHHHSTTSLSSLSLTQNFNFPYSTVTKIISTVEIWFGTKIGSCGVIRFCHPLSIKVCMLC